MRDATIEIPKEISTWLIISSKRAPLRSLPAAQPSPVRLTLSRPLPVDRPHRFAIPAVDEQQQVNEHLNAADMPPQPEGQLRRESQGCRPVRWQDSGGDVEEQELQKHVPLD